MSTVGLPNTDKSLCSRPAHRRQDSGEIDIFEAALYFAGGVDGAGLPGRIGHQRVMREDRVGWRAERKSLDAPMSIILPQECQRVENYDAKEKKGKQPSSPGSKLASFLKSIFHQTASKKKSKSLATTKSLKDGEVEDRHGGRNRRRSIGHSQSIRSSSDSKSIFSSESSVFSTPAPHANILTKLQKKQSRSSKSNGQPKMATFYPQGEVLDDKRVEGESLIAERAKSSDGLSKKSKVFEGGKPDVGWNEGWFLENRWVLNGDEGKLFKKHGELGEVFRRKEKESREEDGGESDSSSDLFELKNYDFGELSSGLPVYGTTDMEIIKTGASIHRAAF
ncbi:protein BIG GRAIN 1-like E [Phoenix dactylifera]|uniref:Protein BIG GRAIN 1-like E n=1 Tax=Phoenix dactylifera TaxID=42345 RepID=A0A8B7BUQ4_PHODC|nr:protein BIG GRAIN 1-like E [Phoenix dactylifera]